ncbi:MAG: enoyl-CoA hydratase/isomerase family protein [Paludibacteraceae bacterium]|nr:enoyl-CoA hydratase/isomerase family protein [Paludibacteraceae bacterium]
MVIGTEFKDRICFIEMQDPQHLNCLSEELCTEMREALDAAYKNECVGVVIKSQISHGVWSA